LSLTKTYHNHHYHHCCHDDDDDHHHHHHHHLCKWNNKVTGGKRLKYTKEGSITLEEGVENFNPQDFLSQAQVLLNTVGI
jgi:hypothetical protein